jgi:DNA-binding winged helix-turn-helix (wHTH) protein
VLLEEHFLELRAGERRFILDPAKAALFDEYGNSVPLTPQDWRLLNFLVERGSQTIVPTDDLVANVWENSRAVSPDAVAQALRSLREKLGRKFITNVYGRGTQFTGSIERITGGKRPSIVPNGASAWSIFEPTGTDGLVELRLHQPRQGNQPEMFYLDATLRVEVAEYEMDDRILLIGLTDAFLSVESKGCQPAKGTVIGERLACEGVHPKPRGVEFQAPPAGRLTGDLLGEEYIAVMEPTISSEQLVTIQVRAGRRSFSVTAKDIDGVEEQTTSTEKTAILNRFIELKLRDEQGRVTLAEARMRKIALS